MTHATVPDLHATDGRSWAQRNRMTITPLLFLAPGVLFFAVYVILPIFQSFQISLYDWDGLGEARDLLPVHEKPARPARLMVVERTGLLVLGNIRIDQDEVAVLDRDVALGDVRLPLAQRLHLGSGQDETCLVGRGDGVVVQGTLVARDHHPTGLGCHDSS